MVEIICIFNQPITVQSSAMWVISKMCKKTAKRSTPVCFSRNNAVITGVITLRSSTLQEGSAAVIHADLVQHELAFTK